MKIWSVSNQKGGVGKTTTVVTLGGLLSSQGYRTLLVDLDPHGSLTSYFKMNPDDVEMGVYNLFRDASEKKKTIDPHSYVAPTEFDGLSVLPASTAIATLDRQVAQMGGMGLVVSMALTKMAHRYDHVIIDSPPMLGVLMINALAACDHLIIPVLAEFLALKGLERMVRTLQMVFHSRKTPPRFIIVPTMFDKRTKAAKDSLVALHQQYADNAWDSVIPVDTRIREASRMGVPLSLFDKNAKAVEAYGYLLESLLLEQPSNTKTALRT
ncbi:MAG: ParA family protein [Methylomonas sp.]|nr:ParA family protein [Methylomonas sp.]PPD21938.1 MAG: cobalamin biosynthesis protein CobQ [Methylomonas sp.]PPD26080.1 MAG: cobalamin biosynthesis protein CobQ [Methylomonas sp.]PPD37798.1 MAG: cobalamin biosynthesis protein CobQ [Methylomonas sp.]PPD40636.1 MAG: cobalamin biosynthesis protein CobQ [Methylomonas sp.]